MGAESKPYRDVRWVKMAASMLEPVLERWFDPEVQGLENIPQGPALLVSNHSGGFVTPDSWILSTAIERKRGVEDVPVALVHDKVIGTPVIGYVLRHIGGVPASAGGAHRVFTDGRKVLVYPGGDLDVFRPWHKRNKVIFSKRRGYIRLALRERVPIVPVVAAGSHDGWLVLTDGRWLANRLNTHRWLRTDVLPITLSVPWGINPGLPYLPLPTRVLVRVLPPMKFEREGPEAADDDVYVEACHQQLHTTMQSALDELVIERKKRGRYVRKNKSNGASTR
jgi:1-acyl-sn-glycerol-3-phosphate acyltransferase